MAELTAAEVVGKILVLLTPLAPEDRTRIIKATQVLLGDSTSVQDPQITETDSPGVRIEKNGMTVLGKARTWQMQNDITWEQLSQVFHMESGRSDVIAAEMPGKNSKEKTLNAYVLIGVAKLLSTGEAKFSDEDARALCTTAGCYDRKHHSEILREKGNWFTGTKEGGWTLTTPGLKYAATLIRTLAI